MKMGWMKRGRRNLEPACPYHYTHPVYSCSPDFVSGDLWKPVYTNSASSKSLTQSVRGAGSTFHYFPPQIVCNMGLDFTPVVLRTRIAHQIGAGYSYSCSLLFPFRLGSFSLFWVITWTPLNRIFSIIRSRQTWDRQSQWWEQGFWNQPFLLIEITKKSL